MKQRTNHIIRIAAAFALVFSFTIVNWGGAIGGPKKFEGELDGNSYGPNPPHKIEFEGGKYAEVIIDFAPKYQRERTEQDCRNCSLKVYDEKGKRIASVEGSYYYAEDKALGEEVIRCRAKYGFTPNKNQFISVDASNANPWRVIYVLTTN